MHELSRFRASSGVLPVKPKTRWLRASAVVAPIAVLVALALPGSAGAFVPGLDPAYVTGSPAGGSSLVHVVDGTTPIPTNVVEGPWADTYANLLRDAEMIPEPVRVPGLRVIPLAVAAFATGYLIGTVANHKWFHINGAGLGTRPATWSPSTTGQWNYSLNFAGGGCPHRRGTSTAVFGLTVRR